MMSDEKPPSDGSAALIGPIARFTAARDKTRPSAVEVEDPERGRGNLAANSCSTVGHR